jgi:Ca2+-binding EF-hand superfamily protein
LYYRFFDPAGALRLATLKNWVAEKFGSMKAAFKVLDADGNGSISLKEFRLGASTHGLQDDGSASILFHMMDKDQTCKVTVDECDFLDKWQCPDFLRVQPDHEGAERLKSQMIEFYHNNPLLAWVIGLDDKWSMCISWEQFFHKSRSRKSLIKGEKQDLMRIWRALDPNLSGWLSLREFSEKAYDLLTFFKQWCVKHHGSIKKMMEAHDENESGMLSRKEFFRFVAPKLTLPGPGNKMMPHEDIEALFAGLDKNGGDTIKTEEIAFLDKWDAEGDVKFERMWSVVFNSLCPPNVGTEDDES